MADLLQHSMCLGLQAEEHSGGSAPRLPKKKKFVSRRHSSIFWSMSQALKYMWYGVMTCDARQPMNIHQNGHPATTSACRRSEESAGASTEKSCALTSNAHPAVVRNDAVT